MKRITRGLDLPISGAPDQRIDAGPPVRHFALLGEDYPGLRPSLLVQEGERVKLGTPLFTDRNNPGVLFTAPAAGVVVQINRGHRRVFQSLVIDSAPEGDSFEPSASDAVARTFPVVPDAGLAQLDAGQIRQTLLESGLWTALRTRPFSKIPRPEDQVSHIFVTAMDTHPLAADPAVIIAEHADDFVRGLKLLARLAAVVVCKAADTVLPGEGADEGAGLAACRFEAFAGPHPAGLPGTHIHFLAPASLEHPVWYIGYQEVIAIGKLFATGQLWVERVVALAGPVVSQPRLLRTRLGASLEELTRNELPTPVTGQPPQVRVISGSVLGGRTAQGPLAYLGRYHQQVSCLAEGKERELLHYLRPGVNKHSVLNVFFSRLLGRRQFPFSTTTNGSPRAMVPVGSYEAVMPLDILPTQLLRYLIVGDTEMAQKLGCLELDEEDLALCTYVCPGKYEYGPILRDVLNRIEKEG